MDSIKKAKQLTKSLHDSVKSFVNNEKQVNTISQYFKSVIDYLQTQYSRIHNFKAVKSDIMKYLENCDFKSEHDFDSIRQYCNLLPELEERLATISRLTQNVQNFPDRYGLSTIIKACRENSIYCAEKMGLNEIEKTSKKSSDLINKLQKIVEDFRIEDNTLQEIRQELQNNNSLLMFYPAYRNELNAYLSAYPHENFTDTQYISEHLQALAAIDAKFSELQNELQSILPYADRYNKKTIETKCKFILEQGRANLIYADIRKVHSLISKASSRINKVKTDFEKENKQVRNTYNKLKSKSVNMWKEDLNAICSDIKHIQDSTYFVNFSINDLLNRIESATDKKHSDIENVKNKYLWLKRSRYQEDFSKLIKIGVSHDTFTKGVSKIKSDRGLFTKFFECIFYR